MFAIKLSYQSLLTLSLLLLPATQIVSQCPVNLGFEDGSFTNWECFSGKIDTGGRVDVLFSGPVANRHTILQNTYPQQKDAYGGFPVNCPNGSGFSIMLGNDNANAQADRVSYTFTVPSGQNVYSIIYNYAVVLQDPDHIPFQQPRFTAKVFDVTSNQYIDCSSFNFAASSSLPGFRQSPVDNSVYYKAWSPVTIKLLGYGGKTLRIEFTVNDCTLGAHFGYAYLDIDEDCTTPIKGNLYCMGAQTTKLTAPFGFKEYHWYNVNFTTLLGTGSTLSFNSPPVPGTQYALELIPYPGSGCPDTLYTTINYVPVPFNLRVSDSIGTCAPLYPDLTLPSIRDGSTPGLTYSYFQDSGLMEYVSTPQIIDKSGIYYVRAMNSAGCVDSKPVKVIIEPQPQITITNPHATNYPNTINITDSAYVAYANGSFTYTYWQDAGATIRLPNPHAIAIAGVYFIKASNVFGCFVIKPIIVNIVPPPPPNAFSPNNDGINDVWTITGIQAYPKCKVNIFNRYGQLVFRSVGYNKPWDGRLNEKQLPVGTYYYVIQFSPQMQPLAGSITLIR